MECILFIHLHGLHGKFISFTIFKFHAEMAIQVKTWQFTFGRVSACVHVAASDRGNYRAVLILFARDILVRVPVRWPTSAGVLQLIVDGIGARFSTVDTQSLVGALRTSAIMERTVRLLGTYPGREKIMRTTAYAAMLVAGAARGDLAKNAGTLSRQLNAARTILRLFDDLPMLAYTLKYGLGSQVNVITKTRDIVYKV